MSTKMKAIYTGMNSSRYLVPVKATVELQNLRMVYREEGYTSHEAQTTLIVSVGKQVILMLKDVHSYHTEIVEQEALISKTRTITENGVARTETIKTWVKQGETA